MKITTEQLEDISSCLQDLADDAKFQKGITRRSIIGTNAVISVFTFLATLIIGIIFYYFFAFNQGVSHSIQSMKIIQEQMVDLRDSMDTVTFSVDEIGQDIGYMEVISTNISTIARSTQGITANIQSMTQHTKSIGKHTRWVRYNTEIINQRFGHLNYSVMQVSQALHHTAKPIKRFFPLP
jgi:predicted PurR-regulated permease PerM